jgi:hypothetical protein
MFSANRIGTPASGSANCAVICSSVGWGSPGVCSSGLQLTRLLIRFIGSHDEVQKYLRGN